jgi:predicted permease
MSVALLVLPDFLLVALGWALHNKLGYTREFFAGMERLVYFVLFPALLIHSLLRTPISLGNAAMLLVATVLLLIAAVVLAWLAAPVLRPKPLDLASTTQCAYRFNTYLGLSLAASLGGAQGQTSMAVILGFGIPIVNVAAVYGLARHSGGNLFKELSRNPLVLSTVIGLIANFIGVRLPVPLDTALARLGNASLALGIVCVGASLSWQGGSGRGRLVSWMLAVKLLAMPILALGLAALLHLTAVDGRMLLLFAALPTASAAYVLATRMGGDGRLVALVISLGTLFSAVTIPLWLMLTA